MEFRWIEWNIAKVVDHGIAPEEAENVVEGATDPYPQYRGDNKFLVWGATSTGRLVQVVFLIEEDDMVFVIHARPLTEKEKRRRRQHRRRKGPS